MFKYELAAIVKIIVSGETGLVVGRCESTSAEPQYLLRYQRTDGATEAWWTENALATP